jgi:hypothetical protein
MLQLQAKSVRRSAVAVWGAIGLALVVTVTSQASSVGGHMNHVTFSGAVALPGRVIPAGTYTFEIANPDTNANLVRVASRDGRIQFLGFTERVQRLEARPPDRIVSLGESAAGVPPPVLAWYPRGTSIGHRFIYR